VHTRLFGVCLTYILVFSLLMGFAELATFPPSAFTISINFSNLIFWMPNAQTSLEFSWSNVMATILTLTLTFLVIGFVYGSLAQSFDMAYFVKILVGTAVSVGIGTTMVATVGDLMPLWLHLFLIYLPCGLLIYSVIDIGGS